MGDVYYYQDGVRLTDVSGGYGYDTYCGPLAIGVYEPIDTTTLYLGSSGIRESSMSSQVPATNESYISDIAFETTYPYSLHPTATNNSINVGDHLVYQNEGITALVGGCYLDAEGNRNGYLAFNSELAISGTYEWYGSSEYIQQQSLLVSKWTYNLFGWCWL